MLYSRKAIFYPAVLIFIYCSIFITDARAQTPADAIMMKPGVLCVDASYEFSWWKKYWEGTLLRENGNIGTLQRHTISPMINLGIIKQLNFMVATPYIITHPTAGQIEGAKGMPDLHFWVKAELFNQKLGPGTFNILATVGATIPVTNYIADYAYSIGMRCPEGHFKAIAQYQTDLGIYVRAQGGYNVRGNSKLPRNYYYTTRAYYSSDVDLPDAVDYSGALGFFSKDKQYKAEVKFDGMNTLGGFDIRRQDMGFPSNKMNYMRLGGQFEYYPTVTKGLGIHVHGSYVLAGRNIGRSAAVGIGVNYAFKLWTPGKLKAKKAAKKAKGSAM